MIHRPSLCGSAIPLPHGLARRFEREGEPRASRRAGLLPLLQSRGVLVFRDAGSGWVILVSGHFHEIEAHRVVVRLPRNLASEAEICCANHVDPTAPCGNSMTANRGSFAGRRKREIEFSHPDQALLVAGF